MRRFFGMAARRKASLVAASVLAIVLAGTALASPAGSIFRIGLSNVITGNYYTGLTGTVSSAVLYIRNNSTLAASTAIRANSPNGGVPLDLRAKLDRPPMTVNSTVKVTNLNADSLDNLNSAVGATANTIVARDASGNITGNVFNGALNGNATTATNAGNANTLNGYAANSLSRVAYMQTANTTLLSTSAATYGGTLSITAPAAGFVRLNGNVTVLGQSCTSGCAVTAQARHIQSGAHSIPSIEYVDGATNFGNASMDRVFAVAAGTNTFDIRLVRGTGDGSIYGYWGELTGEFTLYGSSGSGALGVSIPKNVPLKQAP